MKKPPPHPYLAFKTEMDALMPTEPMMIPAWLGCLRYVIGSDERMAEFMRDTGMKYIPPKSSIERMVDEATGTRLGLVLAIARWMNATVWGEVEGRAVNGDEPTPEEV